MLFSEPLGGLIKTLVIFRAATLFASLTNYPQIQIKGKDIPEVH